MSEPDITTIEVDKLIVGLTGNIATGKSAVMRLAAERGALTVDADKVVHYLMDSDPDLQAAIAIAFGSEVRRKDGRIDRQALGEVVFNDPQALRDLEEMIHPAVRIELFQRISESDAAVAFIEAIKLLEGGLSEACHQIWVTRCSATRQLQRLVICRGMAAESGQQRIDAQPSQAEKVAQADIVIDTDGLMQDTEAQFEMAWTRLPDPANVEPRTITIATPISESEAPANETTADVTETADETSAIPEPIAGVDVRRARPNDIPSVLLLIQRATNGAVKRKRADMLLALGERSYFIGQIGTEVSTVMGMKIENLVASIDEIYVHPMTAVTTTAQAVLREIELSADNHICEIVVAFVANNSPEALPELLENMGYERREFDSLAAASWREAIRESQPDDTFFMMKVLRERVTQPM